MDSYTSENPEILLDDWLPSLGRASMWNEWTEQEHLLQLAGHLWGRALQKWNLILESDRNTLDEAVSSLSKRLEPANRTMAAQDFRHTVQGEKESVADFICRLEQAFKVVYGRESLSAGTRDALLYGQLQEGLTYELIKAPSVSGAQTYRDLGVAAKNEEKQPAKLKKRQQYRRQLMSSSGEEQDTT